MHDAVFVAFALMTQYVPEAQTKPPTPATAGNVEDAVYAFPVEVAIVRRYELTLGKLFAKLELVPMAKVRFAMPAPTKKLLLVPSPLQKAKASVMILSVESVFRSDVVVVAEAIEGMSPVSATRAVLNTVVGLVLTPRIEFALGKK